MHHFYSLTAYIYHQVNWKPQWSHSLRGTLTFQQKAALPTLTVITVEVTSWEEERANSLRAARRQKMNSSMCLSHACRWFQQWLSVLRIYNCHCAAAQGTNSQIEGEAWNITVIGDSLSVSHQPITPPTQQERWGTHTFTHTHTHTHTQNCSTLMCPLCRVPFDVRRLLWHVDDVTSTPHAKHMFPKNMQEKPESCAKLWFQSTTSPLCRLQLQAAGHAEAPQETSAHIIKELLAQRWLSLHDEYTCYECQILSWLWFPGRTPCSASFQ